MEDRSRVAARDALLARTRQAGAVLTALAVTATGGIAGLLARAEAPPAAPAAGPAAPPPAVTTVPRPRRTVYVQVPGPAPLPMRTAAPVRRTAPQRVAAPRRARAAPVAPPRRTRSAPVTRSAGS